MTDNAREVAAGFLRHARRTKKGWRGKKRVEMTRRRAAILMLQTLEGTFGRLRYDDWKEYVERIP